MTWAPFVAALAVMFFARRNPLLVRLLSLAGASVSLVASLWIYVTYDRVAAGFQFQESLPLVPSVGISYLFALDGMSALMCLLTSIIIFAGVFASWTVKERSQEFYALLLILVTGVYGVFVSLDLFVFFLFYEIAVLPMYLLIGIWGSSGEVRPQGIFGWAFGRTGVGTKEYAAMKLTLYLLFGSAFILVGILALYVGAGQRSFSFLTMAGQQSHAEPNYAVRAELHEHAGVQHRHRRGRRRVAVRRPRMQRPDASEDAETDVEGEEHPRLQRRIELLRGHRQERERPLAGSDVEGKDADQDERRPEQQVQRQLHRRVFLGADASPAERPAENTLRTHFAR
jgi:hypothetical protein